MDLRIDVHVRADGSRAQLSACLVQCVCSAQLRLMGDSTAEGLTQSQRLIAPTA
jgi:hypothetical protein